MRGYLRARTSAETDDLVSEVFTSVFTGLDRFSGGESDFRGWLFTIAQRRVVDELRARPRAPARRSRRRRHRRTGRPTSAQNRLRAAGRRQPAEGGDAPEPPAGTTSQSSSSALPPAQHTAVD